MESEYRILQVDPVTLRILDAALSLAEVIDAGAYRTPTAGGRPVTTGL